MATAIQQWLILTIVVPPALSFIYTLAVQVFLAAWHECKWTSLAKPISARFTLTILAIAVGTTLPNDPKKYSIETLLPYFFPTLIFLTLSFVSIYRTRALFIQGPAPKHQDMNGKVVLITGANTGIGKETARQLLAMGATVIMACRSESRAKAAINDILGSINEDTKDDTRLLETSKSAKDRLIFLQCDVSDFESVKKAVHAFHELKLPLHVLINNAGIMMGERRTTSGDDKGLELTMACNHLGHFLLANLLLPALRKQRDARVVIVTSSTYVLAKDGIDLQDLNCEERKYTMFSQYAQSKLANILMGKELLRREKILMETEGNDNKPLSVFMVHPGLVRTDVVRNMPWYLKYPNILFSFVLTILQKSPDAGAYTNVFCATSEHAHLACGEYLSNSEVVPTNQYANDKEAAIELWGISEKIVGLSK
jgi:NAD(P)-dependent dehydrogenase (short-subunit alcohol dehydrogenase family)